MDTLPFVETPWDSIVFGMPTYELPEPTEALLARATEVSGHFTVKVDPQASKALLHRYGFYYCDTLLVPVVSRERFRGAPDPRAGIDHAVSRDALVAICRDSFDFGRFHRDFQMPKAAADQRYVNWLLQLADRGEVFGLMWDGALAGFFACDGPRILLHAVAEEFRGRGLAKHLWTGACEALFAAGHPRLQSSVSAANLAIVNLYASLGFRYQQATDIYHRLTRTDG